MPKVDVYDIKGKKVSDIELADSVFGIEPNENIVHAVLVNYLANQRQGTPSSVGCCGWWVYSSGNACGRSAALLLRIISDKYI